MPNFFENDNENILLKEKKIYNLKNGKICSLSSDDQVDYESSFEVREFNFNGSNGAILTNGKATNLNAVIEAAKISAGIKNEKDEILLFDKFNVFFNIMKYDEIVKSEVIFIPKSLDCSNFESYSYSAKYSRGRDFNTKESVKITSLESLNYLKTLATPRSTYTGLPLPLKKIDQLYDDFNNLNLSVLQSNIKNIIEKSDNPTLKNILTSLPDLSTDLTPAEEIKILHTVKVWFETNKAEILQIKDPLFIRILKSIASFLSITIPSRSEALCNEISKAINEDNITTKDEINKIQEANLSLSPNQNKNYS